jgi:hypothetical protein
MCGQEMPVAPPGTFPSDSASDSIVGCRSLGRLTVRQLSIIFLSNCLCRYNCKVRHLRRGQGHRCALQGITYQVEAITCTPGFTLAKDPLAGVALGELIFGNLERRDSAMSDLSRGSKFG